jgi:hypothetical protein
VTDIDRQIGRLLRRLDELRPGPIRVPLLVRWPKGTPEGRVDESTVFGAVDLLPTLAALGGAPARPAAEIDGENMAPAMRGAGVTRRRPQFWDLREDTVGDLINRSPKNPDVVRRLSGRLKAWEQNPAAPL